MTRERQVLCPPPPPAPPPSRVATGNARSLRIEHRVKINLNVILSLSDKRCRLHPVTSESKWIDSVRCVDESTGTHCTSKHCSLYRLLLLTFIEVITITYSICVKNSMNFSHVWPVGYLSANCEKLLPQQGVLNICKTMKSQLKPSKCQNRLSCSRFWHFESFNCEAFMDSQTLRTPMYLRLYR